MNKFFSAAKRKKILERENMIFTDFKGWLVQRGPTGLSKSQKSTSKILEIPQNGRYLRKDAEKRV